MANDIKRTVTVELRTTSDGTLRAQLGDSTKATEALDKATASLGKTTGATAKASAEAAEATAAVGKANAEAATAGEALNKVVNRVVNGMQGAKPSVSDVADTVKDLGVVSGSATGLLSSLAIAGTAVATVVAALGVAAVMGAQEQERYNAALVLTGHAAGVTTAELDQMAGAMDDMDGVTQRYAAGVLAAVTATGHFSGNAIPMVARAAVQMEQATGQAVNSTIAEFQRLGEDPVNAVAKLNESQHFLTVATYAQIEALQAQGREHEAAAVAQRAYADAVDARTKEVAENVGWLEKAWAGLKATATETWDAMLGLGREQGLGAQAKALQDQIDALQKPHLDRAGNLVQASRPEELARLQAALADVRRQQAESGFTEVGRADDAQATQDAIAARQRLARYASPEDKRDDALKQANNDRLAAMYGVVDEEDRARIEARYQAQVKAANDAYASATRTARPGRSQGDPQYAFYQQDRAQILAEIAAEGRLADARAKGEAAVRAYSAGLNDMLATRQAALDLDVQAVGMGDREIALRQRLIQVDEDYDRKRSQLERQQRDAGSTLEKQWYQEQLDALQSYHDRRVQMELAADIRIREAQADPVTGVRRALANIRDEGQDMAGALESAVTGAFGNMVDAATAWATGTDVSIGDVARSFEAALIKMELQALAAQAATALLGWLGGGFGGTGGQGGVTYNAQGFVSGVYAEGGHVRGPGTETSDSIVARLSNNEYVLRGAAVRKYGVHHLDAMNNLSAPGFAGGGLVGGTSSGAPGREPITVNIYGAENGARVEQSQDTDGARLIEVFLGAAVKDVVTNGRLGQAVNAITGTRRPGRSYAGA